MEIIREHIFDEQVKEIAGNFSRMHELDSAIDWILSRDPFQIDNLLDLGDDIYLWVTGEFSNNNFPKLRICFEYNESTQHVTLMGIQVVEPS